MPKGSPHGAVEAAQPGGCRGSAQKAGRGEQQRLCRGRRKTAPKNGGAERAPRAPAKRRTREPASNGGEGARKRGAPADKAAREGQQGSRQRGPNSGRPKFWEGGRTTSPAPGSPAAPSKHSSFAVGGRHPPARVPSAAKKKPQIVLFILLLTLPLPTP